MKLIAKDNYDRDHIPEVLIKENLTSEEALKLKSEMNARDNQDYFYEVVEDDYILYKPD